MDIFCLREFFSWVNFRGHFLSEFQWTLFDGDNKWCQRRGCGGEAPARLSKHCSVSGQGVRGQSLARLSKQYSMSGQVRLSQIRLGQFRLLLDYSVTLIITIKKSVPKNSPKMSARIHPKYVHKNSPKKRNSRGQKCPREFPKSVQRNYPFCPQKFTFYVHENSATRYGPAFL